MGTVRLGSVLALAVVAGLSCAWSGCVGDGPGQTAYAEIVAEEDARGEAGIDRIRTHMASPDPDVRGLAVRALGRLEDPALVGQLRGMLDDPEPVVRTAAAAAMAQAVFGRDPGEVLSALAVRAGIESDPGVLGSLATNLGRLAFVGTGQREAAGEALAALARSVAGLAEDPGLVARSGLARGLEAFARRGGTDGSLTPDLVAGLTELSGTGSGTADPLAAARVRRLAVAALVHAGRLELDHAANLLADDDWGVRRQALIWAARNGTGAGALVQVGLRNPDPRVRVEALRAHASGMRSDEPCSAILAAVDDPDPHVAATALGLAARPCPDAELQRRVLAARVGELEDGGQGWRGPAQALFALAEIAPGEAGGDTRRFARHGNPFVRAWAARAAGRAGEVDVLDGLSGDEDANVREAALRGLGEGGGAGAATATSPRWTATTRSS